MSLVRAIWELVTLAWEALIERTSVAVLQLALWLMPASPERSRLSWAVIEYSRARRARHEAELEAEIAKRG